MENNENLNNSSSNDFMNTNQAESYNYPGTGNSTYEDFKDDTKEVNEWRYHLTVILTYMFGLFGVHRIINNKKISGIAMLVLTLISYTILLVSSVKILNLILTEFNIINIDDIAGKTIPYMILMIIGVVVLSAVSIWCFVDLIMIMSGVFKDGKTKKKIVSGKPFIKTWSNILILVLVIASIIYSVTINVIVQTSLKDVLLSDRFDISDDYSDSDYDNDNDYEVNEDGDISSCIYDGDYVDFGRNENIREESIQFLESKGYAVVESEYSIFEFSKEVNGYELDGFASSWEDDDVASCSLSITSWDDDFNLYTITTNDFGYDGLFIIISVNSNYISGTYDVDNKEYELYLTENILEEVPEESPYDVNVDELGIMSKTNEMLEIFISELENLKD